MGTDTPEKGGNRWQAAKRVIMIMPFVTIIMTFFQPGIVLAAAAIGVVVAAAIVYPSESVAVIETAVQKIPSLNGIVQDLSSFWAAEHRLIIFSVIASVLMMAILFVYIMKTEDTDELMGDLDHVE